VESGGKGWARCWAWGAVLCLLVTSRLAAEPAYVSVSEAEKLVARWAVQSRPYGSYWNASPKLKEVTTSEIRERLKAQVFRIDEQYGSESFLIKDRRVYQMGSAYGDQGLSQMCVCNIDKDSADELIFTYSCGSGAHLSCVGGFSFCRSGPVAMPTKFHFANADLVIEKRGEQEIEVCMVSYGQGKRTKVSVGSLTIAGQGVGRSIDIALRAHLPDRYLKLIARPGTKPALLPRLDSSIACAARYMIRHQSKDGAWRSETYGFFKDGLSLTPQVLSCIFFTPQPGASVKEAYKKGADYLTSFVGEDGKLKVAERELNFPVLSSAAASRVVVLLEKNPTTLRAQAAWLEFARKRQLASALGWEKSDLEFGGWGFSLEPPRKPAPGQLKEMFFESNMVATLYGIAALRSAKVPADDPVWKDILVFVDRCQNFHDTAEDSDPSFDDGGFYFIPNDPLQNKAGIAGADKQGRQRFHSYGSMTADGLRALIRCGLPLDHPRVTAARKWLETNFTATTVPGVYEKDREVLRDATYYYYCWSVAHAFAGLGIREIETKAGRIRWAEPLAEELMRRQKPDGSWVNTYTDAKEDDPLVATPWAAAALAICRESITGEMKELVPRRPAQTQAARR